jgi:Arc/MetJ-type ribon-helix-helix transcriptional regulator
MKIEEIQLAERRRTGKRPDKSDLVQEALDLLIQKYSNTSTQ